MKKILITGVNGFVGRHLTTVAKEDGYFVGGVAREEDTDNTQLDAYYPADLTDQQAVDAIDLENYNIIISLAGLSRVGESFDKPELYKKVNVDVLRYMLNKLQRSQWHGRVIAVSTGAIYSPDQSLPLTEDSKTNPDASPYAISKLLMEEVAVQGLENGIDVVIARPFNHIGPGQEPGFLVPDMYQNLLSDPKALHVGNVDTKRDYTDVRDVCRAYIALGESESLKHQVYNICSNVSVSGREIIETLAKHMDTPVPEIIIDQQKLRPNDPPELYGDNSRLVSDTNWEKTLSLQDSIADFVKSRAD